MMVDSGTRSLRRTLWKRRIRYESDDWRNRWCLQIQIIMMNDDERDERNDKYAVS